MRAPSGPGKPMGPPRSGSAGPFFGDYPHSQTRRTVRVSLPETPDLTGSALNRKAVA